MPDISGGTVLTFSGGAISNEDFITSAEEVM